MENLVTWTLFFELTELNLEKYEIIFIVSFQVGISDTSKYSTWKEKNGETIREGDYFCPIRELYFIYFFEIWN